MKRLALILLFSTLVLALVIACTPPTPGPGAITDDMGRTVNIEEIPQRIVSLGPGITEVLFALDLGDRVVGVTDYCDYPEEALAKDKVGGFSTPSLERIIDLEPDLILAANIHYPDLVSQLESKGLAVVVFNAKDIDGIFANIELMGQITGTEEGAAQLVSDMTQRIDSIVAETGDAPKPRVFYVIDASDPTKPWTAGEGSFIDALIGLAGGENIAATAGQWTQFSLEALVNADPEIIIFDDCHGTVDVPDFEELSGWSQTTAIRTGRIYPIDGDLTSRGGPRIVDALEEMARMIHLELFQEGG